MLLPTPGECARIKGVGTSGRIGDKVTGLAGGTLWSAVSLPLLAAETE